MTPAKTPKSALVQKAPVRKATPTRVTINVPLPADLHRQLRIKALTDDLTLAEATQAAISQWVKS